MCDHSIQSFSEYSIHKWYVVPQTTMKIYTNIVKSISYTRQCIHINVRGAIKRVLSREKGNIVYTRRQKTKQKHNTIYVSHHYTETNTNSVNKTWTLLQTTGSK